MKLTIPKHQGCRHTAAALLLAVACRAKTPHAPPIETLREADRIRLKSEPFSELSFVPTDAQCVLRVDLAALATHEPETERMMAFVLRAQQPAAWQALEAAGLSPGRELRAVYLVVLPGTGETATLLAGIGDFDMQRAKLALSKNGEVETLEPDGFRVRWRGGGARVYANEQGVDTKLGETSLAVLDSVILFGAPSVVDRALAVKRGVEPDVRNSIAVAREIVSVNASAVAWGAAAMNSQDGMTERFLPGLRRARFHALYPERGGTDLLLRAEFASDAEAERFGQTLPAWLKSGSVLTKGTPMGATLVKLEAAVKLSLAGTVLTATAAL